MFSILTVFKAKQVPNKKQLNLSINFKKNHCYILMNRNNLGPWLSSMSQMVPSNSENHTPTTQAESWSSFQIALYTTTDMFILPWNKAKQSSTMCKQKRRLCNLKHQHRTKFNFGLQNVFNLVSSWLNLLMSEALRGSWF